MSTTFVEPKVKRIRTGERVSAQSKRTGGKRICGSVLSVEWGQLLGWCAVVLFDESVDTLCSDGRTMGIRLDELLPADEASQV